MFELTSGGVLTTLYSFSSLTFEGGTNTDGAQPVTALLQGSDGNFYGTTLAGGSGGSGTVFKFTPSIGLTTLHSFNANTDGAQSKGALIQDSQGNFYGTTSAGGANSAGTLFKITFSQGHASFFTGATALSDGVYYLAFPSGNFFGYYSFLADPAYLYHFDLGYEYVFDAADGKSGVYFYDFKSSDFFYTSPAFPFPYLYDFSLNSVLYYYPDPNNPGHYNTDGIRYFYDFNTATIISK